MPKSTRDILLEKGVDIARKGIWPGEEPESIGQTILWGPTRAAIMGPAAALAGPIGGTVLSAAEKRRKELVAQTREIREREEPAVELERPVATAEEPALAEIPPERERMTKIESVFRGRRGIPRAPAGPEFEPALERARWYAQEQKHHQMKAIEAGAESVARIQAEIQGTETALIDKQKRMEELRKEEDIALNDTIYSGLYPNMPAGTESPTQWVNEQKMIAENPEFSPEMREAAVKRLEDAQGGATLQDAMGKEWWQTGLSVIALALGAFGSALTGTPNVALQFLFRKLDSMQKEQREKRERMGKVSAARERRAAIGIERSEQDYIDEDRMRLRQIELFKLLAEQKKTKYAGMAEAAKIDQLITGMDLEAEKIRADLDQRRWATEARLGIEERKLSLMAMQKAGEAQQVPYDMHYLPGAPQLTSKQYEEASNIARYYQRMKTKLNELKAIRDEYGWEVTPADPIVARAKGLRSSIVDDIRKMQEWGARFEITEEQLLTEQLPADPTKLGYIMERLETFDRSMETNFREALRAYGLGYQRGSSGGGYGGSAGQETFQRVQPGT